jgi:hypothetical protein
VDDILTREWSKLTYFDPRTTLPRMRKAEELIARHGSHLPQRMRELRTNKTKRFRELRDAAIFCYGISTCVVKVPVYYANYESQDFDVMTRFLKDELDNYAPLQLKELPPEELNPVATIQGIYQSLAARPSLQRTVVAIKLNQREEVIERLPRPKFRVGGLWFFGKTAYGVNSWCLFGDCMDSSPTVMHFEYPA